MNRTQELRQLLNELVNAWPDGYKNPLVEEARQYLQMGGSNGESRGDSWERLSSDEYQTELWYSL